MSCPNNLSCLMKPSLSQPINRSPWSWTLLLFVAALFISVIGLIFTAKMPHRSYAGEFYPLSEAERAVRDHLHAHVWKLAGEIGQRNIWTPGTMDETVQYLEDEWVSQGYAIKRQEYSAYQESAVNLEVELPGASRPQEIIVVGAHYDSVLNCPGANDNASGVASMLEISRLLAAKNHARTIRFVAFANEEPPFYYTKDMGSSRYARRSRIQGENIVAMLALETMGYYSEAPNSQKYPFPFNLFYPNTADFIGFVGNTASRRLVREAIAAFRTHVDFPSEGLAAPGFIVGIGWSDHWSFWQEDYPAIMVTDTAFFRYAYYHSQKDTPEKLDYDRLARVVCGLSDVVSTLADDRKYY